MSHPDSPDLGILALDIEESTYQPPVDVDARPRKRRRCSAAPGCANEGLTSVDTILGWPRECWEVLQVLGLFKIGIDLGDRLLKTLQTGLRIATDYSGVGCPEESLRLIVAAAAVELPNLIQFSRAGDVTRICRTVLFSHRSFAAPQCVFGDI